MKRFFMIVLAFCFPWLVLLICDNPGGAIVALIMQASIIGWIPASVWAYRIWNENSSKRNDKSKGKVSS